MREHRTLEIGMTWYGTAWQRTGVNTECKYLLLRHAFEELSARRVCLKSDSRNERSRRAILRLGAVEEGTLRNHRIARDGMDRHTVYYSVIESEWPTVKGTAGRVDAEVNRFVRPGAGAAGRCPAFRQELRLIDERFSEVITVKAGMNWRESYFVVHLCTSNCFVVSKWRFTNNKAVCC